MSYQYLNAKLAKYEASNLRSFLELFMMVFLFVFVYYLVYLSLSISYFLTAFLIVLNGCFLMRIFGIFHDCGHGSFFTKKKLTI